MTTPSDLNSKFSNADNVFLLPVSISFETGRNTKKTNKFAMFLQQKVP